MADPQNQTTTAPAKGAAYVVLALTALAPALGGSTQLWAQGTLAIGAGSLLLLIPPKRSLGLVPNFLFFALLLIALSAFLPATWLGGNAGWRVDLIRLGARLPSTRSAQPELTLQWSCFLFFALTWAYYLATMSWTRRLRETAFVIFALAILVLGTALIVSFITGERIPFWPRVREFGFFPNRNQTGDVMGLGGVMIYALGLQRFQEDRKYWWVWFVSLSLVCWALILNYSRAGIILFFFGALVVHIYWWAISRGRNRPMVALGGLVLLVVVFLIDGGATVARFQNETIGFFEPEQNLRLSIHRDALRLIATSSPVGIGLGNFWPVFAFNRHFSATTSQTAHPESDWLWTGVDLGWVGVLIAFALVIWWITQCPPFAYGTNRLLRFTAMICGLAFAMHGFVDVSAHRLGALWPALLFASLALHPKLKARPSRWVSFGFRSAGAVLLAIGLWWEFFPDTDALPTTQNVDKLRAEMIQAAAVGDYSSTIVLSSKALSIAPLEWIFYFERGVAEASLFESRSKVESDFAIARYLLPNWPDLYLKEGLAWLSVSEPDLAFDIWKQGLQRNVGDTTQLYGNIFGLIKSDPALREDWRRLGESNVRCRIVFLSLADETEFQLELQEMLSEDPDLKAYPASDRRIIFQTWYAKGDKLALAQAMREHPNWEKEGWRELARSYADYEDYRQAYETVARCASPPPLPRINQGQSLDLLAASFRLNHADRLTGLNLALALFHAGKQDDALATLSVLAGRQDVPPAVYWLEGEIRAQRGEWDKAWQAVRRFAEE